MNAHLEKAQETMGKSAPHNLAQKQRGGEVTSRFVDNRPEAIAQRKLQEMADNSLRSKPSGQWDAATKPSSAPARQAISLPQRKADLHDDKGRARRSDALGEKAAGCDTAQRGQRENAFPQPSIERHRVQSGLGKGLRILQAKHFPTDTGPLGSDLSYSFAPMQTQPRGGSRPSGPDVLQRLIVVDDDLDTSRLMAAVRIYYKHRDKERITTLHKAKDVTLAEGEKIYMVAHGAGDDHGGRSAKDLAAILKTWGLHPGSNVIKLISCFSGKEAPEWSYANALALELDFMYKVIGVKGLEGTDEQGHTRATEQVVDDETFEKAYFGTLGDDTSFEKAEAVAKAVKEKIAACKLGEEVPLMVEAYEEVNRLCQSLFKKLEGALKGMTRDKEKRESEDIMTPL